MKSLKNCLQRRASGRDSSGKRGGGEVRVCGRSTEEGTEGATGGSWRQVWGCASARECASVCWCIHVPVVMVLPDTIGAKN